MVVRVVLVLGFATAVVCAAVFGASLVGGNALSAAFTMGVVALLTGVLATDGMSEPSL